MAPSKKQATKSAADSSSNNSSRRSASPPVETERPVGPLSVVIPPSTREEVKVNNSSSTELKNACDDAVKRYLARPELFNQNHIHTDVRLGLGWLSVFVAAGTALYGYKVEFEQSKPVVTIGLVIYVLLTLAQTVYSYVVEGHTIFTGKRKTFSKRIISERIQLQSHTLPPIKPEPKVASPANSPAYHLAVTYVRSTNGGKTLLSKGRVRTVEYYSNFFDENGVMDQEAFEKWVGTLVEKAMDGGITL
ncbi:hypothetical protein CVT24_011278 [Panaeolus cyanescens]|uniref:Signal peptidase complex subunit 2 n=1 Tax=Panaeolus cyanescens TaxID=181874 RepID=A0A409YUY6_9AGAR|nr:hypothetical protein CVT24_011278 [Panaeolus cyanescens]